MVGFAAGVGVAGVQLTPNTPALATNKPTPAMTRGL